MLLYRLSSRQEKDLLRARWTIHVALPNPPERADLLRWARESLDVDALRIVAAEEVEILVAIPRGGDGLTALLGAILDEAPPDEIAQRVVVADVTLRPVGSPRGEARVLKWPGAALVRGEWIPSTHREEEPCITTR